MDARQMEAYAQAFATASQADKSCPDVKVDFVKLLDMRMFAEVSAADEVKLTEALATTDKSVAASIEQSGAPSWCATTWQLYGPEGTGVLAKK